MARRSILSQLFRQSAGYVLILTVSLKNRSYFLVLLVFFVLVKLINLNGVKLIVLIGDLTQLTFFAKLHQFFDCNSGLVLLCFSIDLFSNFLDF